MDAISALKARVQTQEAATAATRQRLAVEEAELKVWREALAVVCASGAVDKPIASTAAQLSASTPSGIADENDRRRGPRGAWRIVMPIAARELAGEFGYTAIEQVGVAAGVPIKRHTLRSQMANYVNSGLLERVKEGTFRFTDKGKDEFKSLSTDSGSSELESERSDEDGAHSSDLLAGDWQSPEAPNNHQLDRDE